MKTLLALLLLALASTTACVTRDQARADANAAYAAGQAAALNQLRNAQQPSNADAPVVTFNGMVKNRLIPWTQELTLVRALVAAEYTGAIDPFTITITREGKEIPVSPRRLLNGNIDPYLEPGDVVTIR
jgi:hypothetical protein